MLSRSDQRRGQRGSRCATWKGDVIASLEEATAEEPARLEASLALASSAGEPQGLLATSTSRRAFMTNCKRVPCEVHQRAVDEGQRRCGLCDDDRTSRHPVECAQMPSCTGRPCTQRRAHTTGE